MNAGRTAKLAAVVLVGFVLRVAAMVWKGEADFFRGYNFYVGIAYTWLAGDGFCIQPGQSCGLRGPVYPVLVAPFLATGQLFPWLPLAQAALGAAMAVPAFWLARRWFGEQAGWIAGGLTAFAPYAVWHDTALQDTVLVNGLVLLGICLLVAGARVYPRAVWALAGGGTLFGLAILTSARVAFLAPAAALWIVGASAGRGGPWRRTAAVLAPIVLLVGMWLVRNAFVVGAPVLTTESGLSLWAANSPLTMAYFPQMSIDRVAMDSEARLSAAQRAELAAAGEGPDNEVARDRVRGRWGLAYMTAKPWETARRMARKVAVVVGAELSPARDGALQVGYRAAYGTLQLLALAGMWGVWQARRDWTEHSLVWLVLLGLLATTAVYWSHTSHRSVVDAVLCVYAAGAMSRLSVLARRGLGVRVHP